MKLAGWGNFPTLEAQVTTPRTTQALQSALTESETPVIARGMGRAYGDAALSANTVSLLGLNKMLGFDPQTGILTVEAGVTLAEIIQAFLPRGWFPYVTPGTKFVSIGGAIAADVHGKNHHHQGSFGSFVDWIDVMGTGGEITRATPDTNPQLFHQTLGGMGLTGIILRAAIRLRPVTSGWIRQQTKVAANLDEAIEIFETNPDPLYSVAWIDCLAKGDKLGRSLITFGDHVERAELPADLRLKPFETPKRRALTMPFYLPGFTLNPLSVRAFNALYNFRGRLAPSRQLVGWDSYFYPLDAISHWNRMYGRAGFMQYQCVLPLANSAQGLRELLSEISGAGVASFLAVLKRMGPQDSALSFPMEGYTLALDFPNNARARALLPVLDTITKTHGGRLYLAKDSRLSAQDLRQMDPRWTAFADRETQSARDPRFASALSKRLDL